MKLQMDYYLVVKSCHNEFGLVIGQIDYSVVNCEFIFISCPSIQEYSPKAASMQCVCRETINQSGLASITLCVQYTLPPTSSMANMWRWLWWSPWLLSPLASFDCDTSCLSGRSCWFRLPKSHSSTPLILFIPRPPIRYLYSRLFVYAQSSNVEFTCQRLRGVLCALLLCSHSRSTPSSFQKT